MPNKATVSSNTMPFLAVSSEQQHNIIFVQPDFINEQLQSFGARLINLSKYLVGYFQVVQGEVA